MTKINKSQDIESYKLQTEHGDAVEIINFGARITKWLTKVGSNYRNIVLGYDDLTHYLSDPFYLGAIAGPYANRIKDAEITIDNKKIALNKNEGNNQLHGGKHGISDLFWQCEEHTSNTVVLICELADGYNGYPGPLSFIVKYQLSGNKNISELLISITVKAAQTSIAGPTSHPYFNLSNRESCQGHHLQVFAKNYTPVNALSIPTGDIKSVIDSRFNLTQSRQLNFDDENDHFDHNFLAVKHLDEVTRDLAQLKSPDNQLTLNVSSNYPAVQIYTGKYLSKPFVPFQGICIEPQFCPNSPNQNNFPFERISANKPLKRSICYSVIKHD